MGSAEKNCGAQLYPDSGDCGSAADSKPDIRSLDTDISEYAGQHYRNVSSVSSDRILRDSGCGCL